MLAKQPREGKWQGREIADGRRANSAWRNVLAHGAIRGA
jgi:hypothetical protein